MENSHVIVGYRVGTRLFTHAHNSKSCYISAHISLIYTVSNIYEFVRVCVYVRKAIFQLTAMFC